MIFFCRKWYEKLRSDSELKGTVAWDFDANFFISIDSPDLGDGPLKGVNIVRCACAEKRAFYALSRALQIGTNALFWSEIALSMSQWKKKRETGSFYYRDDMI